MAQHTRLAILGVLLSFALTGALAAGLGSRVVAKTEVQAKVTLTAAGAYGAPTLTPTPPQVEPTAATDSSEATPASFGPVIAYFSCEPCVVEPGGMATLSWNLSGASAAYLDGRGVTAPGSTVVYPDQTTTYRLIAVNDEGRSEKTVTVEVRGLPSIHYFTCLPCELSKGEQSTLSWDLSGATAAYLDGHGVTAPGNTLVAPDQTTTYRLVAVSERGSVERLVTVTVKEGGDPEAVSEALRQPGYDVRWVGRLPLAGGGDTITVVMAATDSRFQTQDIADQYSEGFKALYDNYPGQVLTVGLTDGGRYMLFVTVESGAFEAFLRGEMDGQTFWRVATWNVWDEWTGRWLEGEAWSFVQQDFMSKNFGF